MGDTVLAAVRVFNRKEILGILPHGEKIMYLSEAAVDGELGTVEGEMYTDQLVQLGIIADHFGLVPGTVILEFMAQVCAMHHWNQVSDKLPLFAAADDVRFKKQCDPSDPIRATAKLKKKIGIVGVFEVIATSNGEIACSATIMGALNPRPETV